MTDEVQESVTDAPEVVQTEAEQVEAPEAAESTEGQVETPPAEGEEGDKPETPEEDSEEISESKKRRLRRKAEVENLRAELEAAETRNKRLASQIEELNRASQSPPPKVEDFENYDDYLTELSAYKSMKRMDERSLKALEREAEEGRRQQQQIQRRQQAEAQQNWAAQRAEAAKRYADFDAVTSAPDLPISEVMAQQIAMADNGADVAYYLGMNKDEAHEIASLHPYEQAGAMRVLSKFVQRNVPKPRTQTSAPEPITPVKPKATAAKRPEDMTVEEFNKWREQGGTIKL